MLFLLAVGGDEAPQTGTTFLISFLNCGERIASSSENYLLFGGNVKENSIVVSNYVKYLVSELQFLEDQVFDLDINGKVMKVEFSVQLIPNDLKMLAFLGGELNNASHYFTTFANVNRNDCNDVSKKFCMDGLEQWKPFSYAKRIDDAAKVVIKKKSLKKSVKSRTPITTFISKELKSRQEFPPLIGKYIDLAKCEPLHTKNNAVKEMFIKILQVVTVEAKFPSKSMTFKEIDGDNIFAIFVNFVHSNMNSNHLSKKLIAWFNENNLQSTDKFQFRFRGKESKNYLKYFPQLLHFLYSKVKSEASRYRLVQIFYGSFNLRVLISYSARITDIKVIDINVMKDAGRNLFISLCLFEKNVSPSLWNLCHAAPEHSKHCIEEYGVGLGINTMEGREQKHQQIEKYSSKATFQNRWNFIFQHEYIQLLYLRMHGFDQIKYNKRKYQYIPENEPHSCICSLPLENMKCPLCGSNEMLNVTETIKKYI